MNIAVLRKDKLALSLIVSILFSVTLLLLRVYITHSGFYLFLLWNLFLAGIPLLISQSIKKQSPGTLKVLLMGMVWLLFLPNAPYIITDLIHLKIGVEISFWYDLFLVSSFAVNGVLFYFLSLSDIMVMLTQRIGNMKTKMVLAMVVFLSSFGIFLGRFQRWNSWDVLQQPDELFQAVLLIIIQPVANWQAWAFTVIFSVFLALGFFVFQSLKEVHNQNEIK